MITSEEVRQNRFADTFNDDVWVEQLAYFRTHLDVAIEMMFPPIRLSNKQKIVARAVGNRSEINIVDSRGAGKTWLMALCAFTLGVLYPGSPISVCSATAEQATLLLRKIDELCRANNNIMNEIDMSKSRNPVTIRTGGGECLLKNGSKIVSMSIPQMRGTRAKIIIADETPEIKSSDIDHIVLPTRNYTRNMCYTYGIEDYTSKVIKITSACLKSNDFYTDFVRVLREMAHGNPEAFALATDWKASVAEGINTAEFFDMERKRMPAEAFDLQYGSIFLGAEANTVFPYTLTEACRTLRGVETQQPKQTKSEYVMSVDIATSTSKDADNTVISVLKLTQRADGTYLRQLVYMRSYHGRDLGQTSIEIRKLFAKFPNIIRIVFDHNGLGDSLPKFFEAPWVDTDTGKEYPAFVLDTDISSHVTNARPILHGVKANQSINQQMATDLRVALEQRTLSIPVTSRIIINGRFIDNEDAVVDAEDAGDSDESRLLTAQEQAIFLETDALQIEMGNIVATVSKSGTYTYGTARANQRKDRYSSLAMANTFVSELEASQLRSRAMTISADMIGVASEF